MGRRAINTRPVTDPVAPEPMTEDYLVPPDKLVAAWEAEVAHTTKDEIYQVALQAARWGALRIAEGELIE